METIINVFKVLLVLLYYIVIAKILMFIMDKIGEFIGLKKLIQRVVDYFYKSCQLEENK